MMKLFDKLGLEVRRKQSVVSQIGFNPHYLRQICNPKTVIDVGVGHGTFALYNAFPNAHFILIEPLYDYKPSIDKIAARYSSEVFYKAVGDVEGEVEFNVDTANLQRSSFEQRTSLTTTGNRMERRKIVVTTLDSIYQQCEHKPGPVLLKLDTEGHELHALMGANGMLRHVDMAIVETSIAKRFEDSYRFEEIVTFMHELGFSVYSMLTLVHPKGELQPRFADVVFKRRDL